MFYIRAHHMHSKRLKSRKRSHAQPLYLSTLILAAMPLQLAGLAFC